MNIVTPPINSLDPILSCQINEKKLVVNEAELFSITVSLIDNYSAEIVSNISWAVNS